MEKTEGLTFSDGILAIYRESKYRKRHIVRDDLLEKYNEFQQEYFEIKKLKSVKHVIDKDLWSEMQSFITRKINKYLEEKKGENLCADSYEDVKKVHKAEYDSKHINHSFSHAIEGSLMKKR